MIARWLCILPVAVAVMLLAALPPDADAESTRLTLDSVPRLVVGEYATFTGSLEDSSGWPVGGATIDIKDDDPWLDDYIATVRTGSDGRFSAKVVVKDWDEHGGATDIYAVFEGAGGFSKSRSATQEAHVRSGGSHADAYASPRKSSTFLTLGSSSDSVYAGDTITFYGQLHAAGSPVQGVTVHIKEDDPFLRDELLATATTDDRGRYSVAWRATAATLEIDFDVYAVFEGSADHQRSTSSVLTLPVIKHSGKITLNPLPQNVRVGEFVTFSGHLVLPGVETTNIIVYVMDEDALNPDDLLATAYVDRDGAYAVSWTARDVDADGIADIYAVFEGDDTHYRLTTCDDGPTRFFGGSCRDTADLAILPARQHVPPGPPGDGYVDLDYSISFTGRPTVAISPSPDSYETVRRHIVPAREGLEMLSAELASRHGGDWRLDYEILEKGKWRADSRADIVVNIITGHESRDCNESFGWAPGAPESLPIQLHVCSTYGQEVRRDADVMRTTTHEFIHGVGLGHVFNIRGDMMCSVENGRATCPGLDDREPRPSGLVLDALASVYGRDGYVVPNSGVTAEYFAPDDARLLAAQDVTGAPVRDPGEGRFVLAAVPTLTFAAHASYVENMGYFDAEVEFLNETFAIPHDIIVRLQECGESLSAYDAELSMIRVCYERVAAYVNAAQGLGYGDDDTYSYVLNNLDYALYQGLGHAMADVHGLSSSEHDDHMADGFASYVMLTFHDDLSVGQDKLYDAATQLYVQSGPDHGTAASRAHDLNRFHRLTCYAYGQDTSAHAYLVTEGWLPTRLAGSCASMHDLLVAAWDSKLDGHMRDASRS